MAIVVPVSLRDTHRLIPAKYAEKSVLQELQLDLQVIHDLSELDAVTNERKIAEAGNSPSIGPQELLYGVPEAHVINAAFTRGTRRRTLQQPWPRRMVCRPILSDGPGGGCVSQRKIPRRFSHLRAH